MKVLVVVDMQKDFIDGALGSKDAQAIVDNVSKKVDSYIANGDFVIYTRDTHYNDYLETQEGKNLPVPHCIQSTPGWEIDERVYREGCPIQNKITFGSTVLPDRIRSEVMRKRGGEIESIEVVGLCTDICVISNAAILKASFFVAPIIVDSACCAGVTPESHQNALNAMKAIQIQII